MKKTTIITGLSLLSIVSVGAAIFLYTKRAPRTFPAIIVMEKSCSDLDEDIIALETKDKIYVDVSRINENNVPEWLGKYDECMSFPDNYWFSEFAHSIKLGDVSDIGAFTSIKLADIKKQLEDGTPSVRYNDFKHSYDKYIRVTITGSKVNVEPDSTYDTGDNLYSFPLIESIVQNHGLTDAAVLEFATGTINSTNTLFFRIKKNATAHDYIGYYDFSNKPPYLKAF